MPCLDRQEQMKRREFILLFASAMATSPSVARAQITPGSYPDRPITLIDLMLPAAATMYWRAQLPTP